MTPLVVRRLAFTQWCELSANDGVYSGWMTGSANMLKGKGMAKPSFVPTREQVVEVFNYSLFYEVLFTFGVPVHDPTDYCNWEAINFNRMAHARLLYDFLEQPICNRYKDNVLAEDFGYPAAPVSLPSDDRLRLNKDLMHVTYDRLRHTPATRPWPDSILANLQEPMLGLMRHVETQLDLFPCAERLSGWRELITCLSSGKQTMIRCVAGADNQLKYSWWDGAALPSGKAALTKFGHPL